MKKQDKSGMLDYEKILKNRYVPSYHGAEVRPIVYVERCFEVDDETYDVLLDFYTRVDYDLYFGLLMADSHKPFNIDIDSRGATCFWIRNLHTRTKPFEGGYYMLNWVLLKRRYRERFIPQADSYIIFGTYNLEGIVEDGDEAWDRILRPHIPLEPQYLVQDCNYALPDESSYHVDGDNYKIQVNNVGQANANEILCNDVPIVVYDFGAPMLADKQTVDKCRDARIADYNKSKPLLIISHWDIDHYHCLVSMTEIEIVNAFSGVICVDVRPSTKSNEVYDMLLRALPGKVWTIAAPSKTNRSIQNAHLVHRYFAKRLSLYVGEQKKRDNNVGGLSVFFVGNNATATLSGDMPLPQLNDILQQEYAQQNKPNIHNLIIPHHGADITKHQSIYNLPHGVSMDKAIISVDQNDPICLANYRHPSSNTISFFSKIPSVVERTDLQGTIVEQI